MNITFNEAKHQYTLNGAVVPSVTQILGCLRKEQLETWRGKLGNEEADRQMKESGDLGTAVHDLCQQVNVSLRAGEPERIPDLLEDCNEAVRLMVEAYAAWAIKNLREITCIEKTIGSETYQYAGRVDLMAWMNGDDNPAVIDLKTSAACWPEMALQLSGYGAAAVEMGLLPNNNYRRLIVRLDKKEPGKMEVKEFTGAQDFNTFLCCLGIYRWKKGG